MSPERQKTDTGHIIVTVVTLSLHDTKLASVQVSINLPYVQLGTVSQQVTDNCLTVVPQVSVFAAAVETKDRK